MTRTEQIRFLNGWLLAEMPRYRALAAAFSPHFPVPAAPRMLLAERSTPAGFCRLNRVRSRDICLPVPLPAQRWNGSRSSSPQGRRTECVRFRFRQRQRRHREFPEPCCSSAFPRRPRTATSSDSISVRPPYRRRFPGAFPQSSSGRNARQYVRPFPCRQGRRPHLRIPSASAERSGGF